MENRKNNRIALIGMIAIAAFILLLEKCDQKSHGHGRENTRNFIIGKDTVAVSNGIVVEKE